MAHTWKLQEGKVKIVEDAGTASLVIIARDQKNQSQKIAVLQEIIDKMRSSTKVEQTNA